MGKFKNADKGEAAESKAPKEQPDFAEAQEVALDDGNPTTVDGVAAALPPAQVTDGVAQDVAPEPPPAQKMNRRYRVIGGPSSVMYNGQRINVTPGKVFIEHSVDLEHLRSQGIQLQLIPEVTSVMGDR